MLLLLEVLAMKKDKSRKHDLDSAFKQLHEKAGVPETYHQESSYHLERNGFDRAIKTLSNGCSRFPKNSQLFRRLAATT